MTPHYDWTPASEPPDTDRDVLAWIESPNGERYWARDSYHHFGGWNSLYVRYWRDVDVPK